MGTATFKPQLIRRIREEKPLTLEAMAHELNVAVKTLWNWENGETEPRADDLAKLAHILGVKVNTFYDAGK